MITLETACRIVQRALPNNRIVGCTEADRIFLFDIPPRRWDGEGSSPAGGELEFVWKDTGKHDSMFCAGEQSIELCDKSETWINHDADIIQYLSTEDAEFAKKVQQKRTS